MRPSHAEYEHSAFHEILLKGVSVTAVLNRGVQARPGLSTGLGMRPLAAQRPVGLSFRKKEVLQCNVPTRSRVMVRKAAETPPAVLIEREERQSLENVPDEDLRKALILLGARWTVPGTHRSEEQRRRRHRHTPERRRHHGSWGFPLGHSFLYWPCPFHAHCVDKRGRKPTLTNRPVCHVWWGSSAPMSGVHTGASLPSQHP